MEDMVFYSHVCKKIEYLGEVISEPKHVFYQLFFYKLSPWNPDAHEDFTSTNTDSGTFFGIKFGRMFIQPWDFQHALPFRLLFVYSVDVS